MTQRISTKLHIEAFDNHFIGKRNVVYERALFGLRSQRPEETIEEFVTVLHRISEHCEYANLREELIRDRLVLGVKDRKLSEKLMLNENLTLAKAVEIARQWEAVMREQQDLNPSTSQVDTTRKVAKQKPKASGHGKDNGRSTSRQTDSAKETDEEKNFQLALTVGLPNIIIVTEISAPLRTKSVESAGKRAITLISVEEKTMSNVQLTPTDGQLMAAANQRLENAGTFVAKLRANTREMKETVYVVHHLEQPLLGVGACEDLQLVKRIDLVINGTTDVNPEREFPKLFEGLGLLEQPCHIKLKEGAKPFSIPVPRRVPLPLMPKLKEQLDAMVAQEVIEPVDEPTEWCAPIVLAGKPNGKIRICVDLSRLNLSVERELHPLPVLEHELAQLNGAKIFSWLDANSGFWQIKLSEESQTLTTFITPFGRYKFKRLPIGISSAPEHFQKRMSAILRGVNGVICHMDDILIFAKRKEEHDETLREVLRRLKNSGITLNKEKCQFGVSNVTFLGHYIDEHGIKADEKKVKAIAEMKPPTDVHGVQRFMGMVNFLGRFVPNLAEITKPLNDLRKKDVSFIWGSPQKKAFEKVKDVLASDRVLASFDISKKTMVSADASSYGLGAVLKQEHEANEWRPVAFASRTLTKTEQGYAQIEKEALAITWACERFKDFVVGKTFLIETDPKPLVPIFTTKDLNDLTPRLQRYRMRMLQFSFHIFHTPGKDLITADALSRQPLPGHLPEDEELQEEVEHFVRSIVLHQSTTDDRLAKIALNQKLEPTLQNVAYYCKNGWPAKCQLSPLERSFYDVRDEIGEENGLLMRGLRVIIPSNMRKDVLNRIHAGHQGITKCRARAKDHVWWPGIGQEIQDMVKTCEKCIENQPLKHEPLIPNDFPERPWQRVGMDIFHYEGSEYLVVVDYFSRFIEVVRLTKLSSEAVVDHCKAIFARHGIPDIVISDNGPQFRPSTTSAFTKFASEVGFRHITSSPKHPQSNGQAEAAVKIVKNLMKKNKDPVLALMEYRATPLANGLSPAELLFGRKIRTMVPCTSSSLTPKTVDQSKLRGEEERRKMAQKTAFDRRHAATKKAELIAGEKVWVKDLRAWGSVIEKASAPRSYIVETPVGTYRRNSLLLASSQQQLDPSETSPDIQLPAETEETPGNELPAEELQQLPAIAPEMKQLSPSPGKVSRALILYWIILLLYATLNGGIFEMEDENIKNLMYYLTDSALEWYADEIISNPAIKRWEVVKEKLIQRFGSYNANPIVSASHRRLKREESIENYFQDKIRLLNQTHLTKEEKINLLTDGLPNDWKDLIVAAQPTDATKWFHIAASIEQNRASIQFKPKNKIHLATKNNDNRKNVCPFWCPICSKKGIKIKHWVTDCEDYDPNYKKDRPNQNTSVKQVCGAPELLNVSTLTNTPTQGAFKLINISVEVNGIPAQAFVDTGATVSIINWRLFKRTRLQLQPNSDIHISQADGVTRTCGSLQTKVRIDKLIKPVTLHVMKNFKYPLLIGLDVASLFNLLIDVKDKTIYTKFDGLQNPILVNHLEEIREHELKKFLEHNRNVFSQHAIDLGKVAIQHKIITKSEQPISLRPYRRPLKEYEEIAEQVKELLEHKLIRISDSPWAFPVVMVPKKDGNKRMCIDYRRLNEITLDDRQPLPHIQDMFDRLHGSRFFSTLDVAWGYWQIEMDPQSIQKTAFVTNDGHYEFLVIPFGLKNAASTFQRIIQHILGELLWKGTCSFQDDILVYTKTWQEHIELLSKVFDKLRQYNMKLKLSKCIFGRTEVKYLGHIISHNQLKPDPGKVKSIQDFPRPDTVKKVRQFMGLANYYRKFVKDFSKISFPLVRLTRKNQPFIWNEEVEESFAKLKMALSTKPVLAIYNPDYPSKVYTDASKYGIGAIQTQIGPDNEEHVIAYYSKTLQPHQENYSAYEMECLAVIQATDHFHVYIENQPFEIITDHAALQWLFTMKKPKPKYFRWILSLSSKSCNIVHRSGKQQTHVDALSRLPVVNIATQELQEHQQNSDLSFLKNSHTHDGVVMIKQKGVFKAVVPNSLTKKILEEYHDSLSHPSITKTCKLITQCYWWKGITTDIKNYVRSCKSCQLVKVRHEPTLGEMITPTSNIQPLQMIGCDTIVLGTAAANTKHKFIQVFVDHATRYLWAYPTITNTAQAVTQCLDKIIKSVNSINTILTDNGKNFISKEFNKFLSLQGIKHTYTSPYHPQCNGICEKLNDTIMTKLRIAVLEKPRCKWSSLLPQVVKNYNSTPLDVTGFSPLFLMYGIGNVPEFADQTPITIEEARKKASLRTEQVR
ncbi:K02A2.6-like, partial [Cordylochernes scorpioides]